MINGKLLGNYMQCHISTPLPKDINLYLPFKVAQLNKKTALNDSTKLIHFSLFMGILIKSYNNCKLQCNCKRFQRLQTDSGQLLWDLGDSLCCRKGVRRRALGCGWFPVERGEEEGSGRFPVLSQGVIGREGPGWGYLVQLPVELCRAEGVGQVEVLAQQQHEAAVVHVQGVVVPVHLCRGTHLPQPGLCLRVWHTHSTQPNHGNPRELSFLIVTVLAGTSWTMPHQLCLWNHPVPPNKSNPNAHFI